MKDGKKGTIALALAALGAAWYFSKDKTAVAVAPEGEAPTDGVIEYPSDYELPPGPSLSGVITDTATGLPLQGVAVELWYAGQQEIIAASYTRTAGDYLIENIPPGTHVMFFIKAGYTTGGGQLTMGDTGKVLNVSLGQARGALLNIVTQALNNYGPIVDADPIIRCMVAKKAVWKASDRRSGGIALLECCFAHPESMVYDFNRPDRNEWDYWYAYNDYLTQAVKEAGVREYPGSIVEFGKEPWVY